MKKLMLIALIAAFGMVMGPVIAQAQDVDLEITPEYQEVALGGTAEFTVTLTNNTDDFVFFGLEAEIIAPEFDPIDVTTPPMLTLWPNAVLTVDKDFYVPTMAPVGEYTLTADVVMDGEVIDSASAAVLVYEEE